MKLFISTLIFSFLHFAASFIVGFATGLGNLKGFWVTLQTIFTFPLSVIPSSDDSPAWLGWALWLFTSLMWGFIAAYLFERYVRR